MRGRLLNGWPRMAVLLHERNAHSLELHKAPPMALAPPASPPSVSPARAMEPLRLPWDLRLTPEQFERVCQANPEAVLELAADGTLIAMTPTGGETGARGLRLGQRLQSWIDGPGAGAWIAFDSSTGFRLADGSVLSPDLEIGRAHV